MLHYIICLAVTSGDLGPQPGVARHTYNPSTWEVEAGGSGFQGDP